jgi:hypothetical protein
MWHEKARREEKCPRDLLKATSRGRGSPPERWFNTEEEETRGDEWKRWWYRNYPWIFGGSFVTKASTG